MSGLNNIAKGFDGDRSSFLDIIARMTAKSIEDVSKVYYELHPNAKQAQPGACAGDQGAEGRKGQPHDALR